MRLTSYQIIQIISPVQNIDHLQPSGDNQRALGHNSDDQVGVREPDRRLHREQQAWRTGEFLLIMLCSILFFFFLLITMTTLCVYIQVVFKFKLTKSCSRCASTPTRRSGSHQGASSRTAGWLRRNSPSTDTETLSSSLSLYQVAVLT